jgi:hypothetical protein
MPWRKLWSATAGRRSSTPIKAASSPFTGLLVEHGVAISMDGKGRFLDNIFIERLWRSLKYEEVFIKAYATVAEARAGIGGYLTLYNDERPHQALGYRTPREVFEAGAALWICGRSASPNGCASPVFRLDLDASRGVGGNTGECSPSPTYPQGQQQTEIDSYREGRVIISPP